MVIGKQAASEDCDSVLQVYTFNWKAVGSTEGLGDEDDDGGDNHDDGWNCVFLRGV